MTQDILDHLQNIHTALSDLLAELDTAIENKDIDEGIADELDNKVATPLSTLLDSLSDITESLEGFDDIEYYNDPYKDEDNNY